MPILEGNNGDNYLDHRSITIGPPGTWPVGQQYYQIYAYGGNDIVYGTKWADYIDGGEGNDRLYGDAGNDAVDGKAGLDTLYGGEGNDSLDGGAGNDILFGENGNDILNGGSDADQLAGGNGADTLYGEAGNDIIFGEAGTDFLLGGYGADILDGGTGADRLWGDSGNDQYQYGGVGKQTINDGLNQAGYARSETNFDTGDVLLLTGSNYTAQQIALYKGADNGLIITTKADAADGVFDNSITIEGFFRKGHYTVEWLQTVDDQTINLTGLYASAAVASSVLVADYGLP